MDVREKLVELLDEAEEWADHKCDELDCETCYAGKMKGNCVQELMVDRLIANGVTVQDNTKISDEFLEQLRNAPVTILQEEPTIEVMQEWISVKDERKPRAGEDVLVVVFDGYDTYTDTDCLMRNGKWCYETENHKVTHWQYLPEPPKGE